MLIRKAPEKLSNTKLSPCGDIIKNLSGDNWNIKIRPHSIYNKLAEHPIFQEFAYSNQALCKKLRPFYEKLPNENGLKSKLDSLQDKISYTSPRENNLPEYLANLLWYKAFLLDAKSQIPQARTNEYSRKIGPENIKKLQDQEEKVEKCEENLLTQKEVYEEQKVEVEKINNVDYSNYKECEKEYQQRKESRDGYQQQGYDTEDKDSEEYNLFKKSQEQFDA
ncbi:MAG: hypothetical protein JSW66_03520, partial [Phycisphaerales bacterium]